MAAMRKPFFKERTVAQIRAMGPQRMSYGEFHFPSGAEMRGAAVVIDMPERSYLIPPKYFRINDKSLNRPAARYFRDEKEYALLSLPASREALVRGRKNPEYFMQEAWSNHAGENTIGFSWFPRIGNDLVRRVVPLVSVAEGIRLASYTRRSFAPDEDKDSDVHYFYSRDIVLERGADATVKIPSREKGAASYVMHYRNVPLLETGEARAFVWSMSVIGADGSRGSPMNEVMEFPVNPRVTWEAHKIAGYLQIIRDQLAKGNDFPLKMCPFPILSARGAAVYDFINNNLLINDKALDGRFRMRKPYASEKSKFIAKAITDEGFAQIAHWHPGRDGPLGRYPFTQAA